ncbi:hypothetical protein AALP_AA3G322100 [Arabis alpina]|uniref:Uncharacterized protein n=1 Tax=Arabis alpina TaxID=50452 RepID=A0A087HD38_ARAAL|nr:hypothetical protein AALP_AA3G322100 [Arabis alpina]
MMIKRIVLCIELMKLGMELVVVVAEAVRVFMIQSHPPPPVLLLHDAHDHYSFSLVSPSHSSPYIIGFLP